MNNTTKIITAWELFQQKIPKTHIGNHLEKNRETIRIWIAGISKYGLKEYLEIYDKAKKGEREKRQLDPILKRRIWGIREREAQCCGEKFQYFLKKEYGLKIATSTIYIALKERFKLRSKWKKNTQRGVSIALIIIGLLIMIIKPLSNLLGNFGLNSFITGLIIAFAGFFYFMDVQ